MPAENMSHMETGEMLGQPKLDQRIRFCFTLPMN
jgi:hypothetical protein